MEGNLMKMKAVLTNPVQYHLPVGSGEVHMNELIGREIGFEYSGQINCIRCGNRTKTSFAQGYCYPCFIKAPETSECVLRPELCRAHEGISRDMEWSRVHCLQEHFVYLAVTGGLKVGVTRSSQVPIRWIDQGAARAIRLAGTPNRYLAGEIEVFLKGHMADKTNWRMMLRGQTGANNDLVSEKYRIRELLPDEMKGYLSRNDEVVEIRYPVSVKPDKIRSIGFDKVPYFEGKLSGIRGQYLIFGDGTVINIRKHGGYLVRLMF